MQPTHERTWLFAIESDNLHHHQNAQRSTIAFRSYNWTDHQSFLPTPVHLLWSFWCLDRSGGSRWSGPTHVAWMMDVSSLCMVQLCPWSGNSFSVSESLTTCPSRPRQRLRMMVVIYLAPKSTNQLQRWWEMLLTLVLLAMSVMEQICI